MHIQIKPIIVYSFVLAFTLLFPKSLWAQYEPPQLITLTMYRLNSDGSRVPDDNGGYVRCTKGNTDYGCTVDEGNTDLAYPFNRSTITISIDETDGPDNNDADYRYAYLWDVVTKELGVHVKGDESLPNNGYVPHAAIEAQAIAARTYTYHRDEYFAKEGIEINNSTTYHLYLPHSYEALLDEAQKEDVRLGTQRRLYLTESNTSYPMEALYGADSPAQTVAGMPTLVSAINYLRSVEDPISAEDGSLEGNGIGFSSKGAKRWSYGHQVDQPPADFATEQWSVHWENAFQILTHYYSGIHIRDADHPSATVSQIPDYR